MEENFSLLKKMSKFRSKNEKHYEEVLWFIGFGRVDGL